MYEWGETIFHTKSEFLRMSPWRRRVWRVLRWPPLFFPLASLGTWYLKFRIPYEWVLRGVPGAARGGPRRLWCGEQGGEHLLYGTTVRERDTMTVIHPDKYPVFLNQHV